MDPFNLPKFVFLHKNHKYRLKLGFYAAPSNPKLFSKTVKEELENLKFTYCSDLNGLIMGFGKISSNELIPADTRHSISVAVYVDVYIFKPPVGSIIEAVVNQTSDNHVSCLVHNLFNVSIVRPEDLPCDQWSGSKVKKDDKINVKVLSFDLTKKLPHITGEIINNESDEYDNPKNIISSCSEKSSSSEECVSDLIKPQKDKNKEDAITPLDHSSSDSESSSEMNMNITRSRKKSIHSFPLLNDTSIINSKLIKNPFSSSTPISNSDHSIDNINLIKNKQIEQLQKHIAKNSNIKQTFSTSNEANQVAKNSIFHPSINSHDVNTKINDKSYNELDLLASSMKSYDNSDSSIKIHKHNKVVQSDSGISGDEHAQNKVSNHNLFSNSSLESSKTNKKLRSSDNIVGAILHSLSPNKNKSETNILKKLSVDLSVDSRSNDDEMNNVYTQHTLDTNNSKKEMLNNNKTLAKPTLRLSTKRIEESDSPTNINLEDSKNQVKIKSAKKENLNDIFSVLYDSESSSDDDIRSSVKNIINCTKLNESDLMINNCVPLEESESLFANKLVNAFTEPKQIISKIEDSNHLSNKSQNQKCLDVISSSDEDVLYTKLKQNVSKIENSKHLTNKSQDQKCLDVNSCSDDGAIILKKLQQNISKIEETKSLTEKTQNKKNDDTYSSDDESDSSIELKCLLDSLKLHNVTNSIYNSETEDCRKNKENGKKRIELNEKETSFLQSSKSSRNKSKALPNITSSKDNKSEITKHILKNDSDSDDEMECTYDKNNISDEFKLVNKIDSDKFRNSKVHSNKNISTTLKKEIPNPFVKLCSEDSTSSSSEDNSFLYSLTKSKLVNNSTKSKITESAKKKDNKDILIQQFLSSVKHKDKTSKQLLPVENFNISEDISKSVNIEEPNKDKSTVKNKKNVLKKSKNSIEEPKPNKSITNVSQIDVPLQLKSQPHIDDSTDDDDIFIKKNTVKRKLNLTGSTDIPEAANLKKLKIHNEGLDIKLDKKFIKSSEITTDKFINNKKILNKERSRENKDLLINNFINTIENSNNSPTKTKRKKNDHFSTIDTNESLIDNIMNSIENSSSIYTKIEKKEKDDCLINQINDLPKNKKTDVMEISLRNPALIKKKKDRLTSNIRKNDLLINSVINALETSPDNHAKIKKKKKRDDETNDLTKTKKIDMGSSSNNPILTKKKKKDHAPYDEKKNLLINSVISALETSPDTHVKIKKKKKRDDETNDLTKSKENDIMESSSNNPTFTKEKKKDHTFAIETNDLSLDSVINTLSTPGTHTKIKKKKTRDNPINETNDLIKTKEIDDIKSYSSSPALTKKKKIDLASTIEINNFLIDNVIGAIDETSPDKIKKKKKYPNSNSEINDLLKSNLTCVEKYSSCNPTSIKKKKKDHSSSTNDLLINSVISDIETSPDVHVKIKKKKKKDDETNDITKTKKIDMESFSSNPILTKKKKKDYASNDETNDLLINSVISALETSSDTHTKIKKTKKNPNLVNEINDLLKNLETDDMESSSSIPTIAKKKKKRDNVMNETNDLTKTKETDVMESFLGDSTLTKKKKKHHTSTNETKDVLINNVISALETSSDTHTKIKKTKKNLNLINEIKNLLKNLETDDMESSSSISTKVKKKKNYFTSTIDTNDALINSVRSAIDTSSDIDNKIKKKNKKKNEANDLTKIEETDFMESFSSNPTLNKKKKKSHVTNNESKDLLINSVIGAQGNSSDNHTKIKNKNLNLINETNDLLKNNVAYIKTDSSSSPTPSKKKKKDNTSNIYTNDLLINSVISAIESSSDIHAKIKKKKKRQKPIIVEPDDAYKDTIKYLSKIKKKKHSESLVKSKEQSILTNDENEGSTLSTKSKKKKKVTRDKMENNSQSAIPENLIKVNETLVDKKTGVVKKKKRKSSISYENFDSIIASLNNEGMNNLKYLYNSLNI